MYKVAIADIQRKIETLEVTDERKSGSSTRASAAVIRGRAAQIATGSDADEDGFLTAGEVKAFKGKFDGGWGRNLFHRAFNMSIPGATDPLAPKDE